MVMKSISTMPESQRRAAMARLAELIEAGYGVTDIALKLNIPEPEIRDAIDWVKNVKSSPCGISK